MAKLEKSGARAKYVQKWPLFDVLRFLEEVSRPRKTISYVLSVNQQSEEGSQEVSQEMTASQWLQIEIDDSISDQEWSDAGLVSPSTTTNIGSPSPTFVALPMPQTSSARDEELPDVGVVSPISVTTEGSGPSTSSSLSSSQVGRPHSQKLLPSSRLSVKKRKVDDRVCNSLENISRLLSEPEKGTMRSDIDAFCRFVATEMEKLPEAVFQDFKDNVPLNNTR